MSARPVLSFALLGLAASLVGCLLDAGPYSGGEAGAGASIHTGGLGGSTGGTTTGGTSTGGTSTGGTGGMTLTTTSSTLDPMCPGGCDDQKPCTDDSCDNGACKHTNKGFGDFVSNMDGTDCVEEVCDGNGGITTQPNDTETPSLLADNECQRYVCNNGGPKLQDKPDFSLCLLGSEGTCQQGLACLQGQCQGLDLPNGNYNSGQCGKVSCVNGSPQSFTPDDGMCLDFNILDCEVPVCVASGFVGNCQLQKVPPGTECNLGAGHCNAAGDCM